MPALTWRNPAVSELSIVVVLHAKKGREEQLRKDLTALVPLSRKEEGNLSYDLFVDQADPGRFVFVERWASEELRQKHHTESAHIQRFHAGGVEAVERTEVAYMLDRIA